MAIATVISCDCPLSNNEHFIRNKVIHGDNFHPTLVKYLDIRIRSNLQSAAQEAQKFIPWQSMANFDPAFPERVAIAISSDDERGWGRVAAFADMLAIGSDWFEDFRNWFDEFLIFLIWWSWAIARVCTSAGHDKLVSETGREEKG